jgi:hypothetical protein
MMLRARVAAHGRIASIRPRASRLAKQKWMT